MIDKDYNYYSQLVNCSFSFDAMEADHHAAMKEQQQENKEESPKEEMDQLLDIMKTNFKRLLRQRIVIYLPLKARKEWERIEKIGGIDESSVYIDTFPSYPIVREGPEYKKIKEDTLKNEDILNAMEMFHVKPKE